MKRVVFLYVVMLSVSMGQAWAEDPVHFADAKLKALVEAELGVTDPTPTDMLGLTSLSAYQKGLTSLTGLETATNLFLLSTVGNDITDVSPLSGLVRLQSLIIGSNSISDVGPLADLTGLRLLSIYNNDISDVGSLAGLRNLRELRIGGNAVSDVSPLGGADKPDGTESQWQSGRRCLGAFRAPETHEVELGPHRRRQSLRAVRLGQSNQPKCVLLRTDEPIASVQFPQSAVLGSIWQSDQQSLTARRT